jgi:hypothetical protein
MKDRFPVRRSVIGKFILKTFGMYEQAGRLGYDNVF